MGADVIDRLLDGADLLGFFVGNFALELVFQRHHQFDRVELVGAEVLDERGFILDVGFVDAKLLGNDLLDPRFNVFHCCFSLREPLLPRAVAPASVRKNGDEFNRAPAPQRVDRRVHACRTQEKNLFNSCTCRH